MAIACAARFRIGMSLVLFVGCGSSRETPGASPAPDAGYVKPTETAEGSSEPLSDAGSEAGPSRPRCDAYQQGVSQGTVASNDLEEISGIAASRKNPGVFWVHNDAGNAAKIYAIGAGGEHLGAVTLSGVGTTDFEDIAVGSGPDPNLTYVYAGDIGDNDEDRSAVHIHRFSEPVVTPGGALLALTVVPETLDVTYSDGPHNAEALLFDPIARELLIVTKTSGPAAVYRVAADFAAGASTVAEKIASVETVSGAASGGDISPNGDEIILRTDNAAMWWWRAPGTTVAQALAGSSCPVPTKNEPNGEALAFRADGTGYVTVSEGAHPPVYFFARTP